MKLSKYSFVLLWIFLIPFVNSFGPLLSITAGISIQKTISMSITVVKTVQFVRGLFKEDEIPIDYQPHLDALSVKLDEIQKHSFDSSIEIFSEVNMVKLKEFHVSVNATIGKFQRILKTAANDSIVEKLDAFIKQDDREVDYKMMDFLSNSLGGSSVTKRYADLVKQYSENHKFAYQASPSSLVYQLQVSTLFMAMQYVNVFEYATLIRNKYQNTTVDDSEWIERKQGLMDKFNISVRSSSAYVRDPVSFSSYLNLKSTPVRFLRFRKVFQTYWKNEKSISSTQSCCGNCKFDESFKRTFDDGICSGFIGNCVNRTSLSKISKLFLTIISSISNSDVTSEKYFISKNPDRIYNYYTLSNENYGIETNDHEDEIALKYFTNGLNVCDVCRCTCDQYNAPNTVRKVYAGKISAPLEQVITGVRFQMAQNVLFLNIQYGSVIGLGIVDPLTLKWHIPPSDLKINNFNISFDLRQFALDDVYFNDGNVLTGIQLSPLDKVIRVIISGSKITKMENTFDILETEVINHRRYSKLNEFKVQDKIQGIQQNNDNFSVKRSDTDNVVVEFGTSNEKTDAGQTTVPFFDGSDIIQQFPLVLSGIGFIHYTNADHAGYLRPILKSADMKFVI